MYYIIDELVEKVWKEIKLDIVFAINRHRQKFPIKYHSGIFFSHKFLLFGLKCFAHLHLDRSNTIGLRDTF